jgi:hypothetical protein
MEKKNVSSEKSPCMLSLLSTPITVDKIKEKDII